MPCLLALIAFFFPRFVMVVIAIFTQWFHAAFESFLWPLLGFLFMPYTTLDYMAAMLNNNHAVNGGWLVLVIIAAFIDLGGQGHSVRKNNQKRKQ